MGLWSERRFIVCLLAVPTFLIKKNKKMKKCGVRNDPWSVFEMIQIAFENTSDQTQ